MNTTDEKRAFLRELFGTYVTEVTHKQDALRRAERASLISYRGGYVPDTIRQRRNSVSHAMTKLNTFIENNTEKLALFNDDEFFIFTTCLEHSRPDLAGAVGRMKNLRENAVIR